MQLTVKKSTVVKIIRFLKWTKIAAKLAAIGTTVSGAIAALSGSATTGIALSAAGATTYAASKGLPQNSYEKTKHVPPGRVNKQANMLRIKEMEQLRQSKSAETQMKSVQGNMLSASQPARKLGMRQPGGMSSAALTTRKK
jgi:hypothetical protein